MPILLGFIIPTSVLLNFVLKGFAVINFQEIFSAMFTSLYIAIISSILVISVSILMITVSYFRSNKFQKFLCRALVTYVSLFKSIRYKDFLPVKSVFYILNTSNHALSNNIILDGDKNINGKSQKNSCMKKPFTVPEFYLSQQHFFAALFSGLLFLIREI